MTTDPKIYTAAEVASAWFSKEEIDQALAKVTQGAYEAAKSGKALFAYHANNLNFLNEITRYLMKLGYATEVIEKSISGAFIVVRWDTAKPDTKEAALATPFTTRKEKQ